jgi:hypothetical protein
MHSNSHSAFEINRLIGKARPSRGLLFGLLILGALLAFELFNYSTTDFALTDLMGDLRFAGVRWSAILAIAFCAIDFAGIARLFTPEKGTGEQREVWYLFGAWMLAAIMNAMLTYWGVAIAILNHASLGGSVVSQADILKLVPVFVAIMVWVIRVLIIGSFSVAGDRLFSQSESTRQAPRPISKPSQPQPHSSPTVLPAQASTFKPAPKLDPLSAHPAASRPEPTYQPASLSAAPRQPQLHK